VRIWRVNRRFRAKVDRIKRMHLRPDAEEAALDRIEQQRERIIERYTSGP